MSVKVAIRVRPFNEREKKLGSELCVKMSGQTVILLDDEGNDSRKFNYDYAIWSHDGFVMDDIGYFKPKSALSKYWDQQKVYNELGHELLLNAVRGYHCCIFAYGQTGSGKSYSIFGYNANKGIVPMICNKMFDGTQLVKDEKNDFTVHISMLEIYNEKIQDLLIDIKKRPKYGLKVHENPKLGVFVKGLSKIPVNSYKEIEQVIETGNKNKTIGSTLMNATSSRSHTIIRVEVHQKEKGLIKTIERFSCINLVDLAGSEKISKTGATGDRLKEACSINKSLMTLGIVIKQLVKKQNGEKTIISYRNSVLTRILQNALGGNSKTTMICAISPSRDNYDETMSTLRYANEAKRIKNNAKINESEVDKMIRELQEENQRLKEILSKMQGSGSKPKDAEITNIMTQIEELDGAIRAKTGQEDPKNKGIDPNSRQTQKMVQMFKKKMNPEELLKSPHLINLNEDMMQSGNIIYNFNETPKIVVGRNISLGDSEKGIDTIVLNSAAISQQHASLVYEGGTIQLLVQDETAAGNTTINGIPMLEYEENSVYIRELTDLDRIIFGTSSTYLIRIPGESGKCGALILEGREITWDLCQMEKAEVIKAEEEEQKKLEEEERKKEEEKHQEEIRQMQEMIKKLEQEQKKMEEAKRETTLIKEDMGMVMMDEEGNVTVQAQNPDQQNVEITKEDLAERKNQLFSMMEKKDKLFLENRKREQREKKKEEAMKKQRNVMEEKMIQYFPKVIEANCIAEQLNRRIEFVPFMTYRFNQNKEVRDDYIRQIVKIKVINKEDGHIYLWDMDTFDDRFSMIQEQMNHFLEYNELLYEKQEDDPFWDPPGLIFYGEAVAKIKDIIYRFEVGRALKLTSYEGEVGTLEFHMEPCDETGNPMDQDDLDDIDNPEDLIENEMPAHFKISIKKLKFENGNTLNRKFRVKMDLLGGNGMETLSTDTELIRHLEVPMKFNKMVLIPEVNKEIIAYYMDKLLRFHVFIESTEKVDNLGRKPSPILKKEKVITIQNDIGMISENRFILKNKLQNPVKVKSKAPKPKPTKNKKMLKKGKGKGGKKDCRIF
jgi:hypothetical protein